MISIGKTQKTIFLLTLISFVILANSAISNSLSPSIFWRIPLGAENRKSFNSIKWEKDAHFMSPRIGGHLHTGIDLMKSIHNVGAKIYAASNGRVVSIYAREPHKAVMVMHQLASGETIYSVYVHITDIQVSIGETVDSNTFIARLMNAEQLNKYGWEFNHVHFEILRGKPRIETPGKYLSYSVLCNTQEEVNKHFYNPVSFFHRMWNLETAYKKDL